MIKYTITRFGNYINEIEGSTNLHKWLLDNVPPIDKHQDRIPKDATYREALSIAKEQKYIIN